MVNEELQAVLDTYKTHYIPLPAIWYRWAAPQYPPERTTKVNGMYEKWSVMLKNTDTRTNMAGKDQRILRVYNSMIKTGITNPLIVKQHSYDENFDKSKYYVVVGNQRLACLRAYTEDELPKIISPRFPESFQEGKWLIPCYIAREEDNWEDSTFAVKKYITNTNIPGFQ